MGTCALYWMLSCGVLWCGQTYGGRAGRNTLENRAWRDTRAGNKGRVSRGPRIYEGAGSARRICLVRTGGHQPLFPLGDRVSLATLHVYTGFTGTWEDDRRADPRTRE